MHRFHARRTTGKHDHKVPTEIIKEAMAMDLAQNPGDTVDSSAVYGDWIGPQDLNEYARCLTLLAHRYPGWRFSIEVSDGT